MVGAPFVELFRNFVASEDGVAFLVDLIDGLPMAVILYDVTVEAPEVVYLNQVARPVGIPVPEPVHGLAALDLFPQSGVDQDRWVREAAAARKPQHISEYETGDRRIWEADVVPLVTSAGPPTYVLVMGIEVTETVRNRRREAAEHEAQAEMLRADAAHLENLEKVKSDFLNLASHELRGPLAVLRGYLSMLSDGSLGELPPRASAVLPALNGKASQMALLVTQMLEAARLEDSQLQLKLSPTEMGGLVRRAVDTMGQLTAPGQSILLQGGRGEMRLLADADRVETILVNLLDNALKYSPGGGGVRVEATSDGAYIEVTVADKGVGIAADDLPRLFTRFGRLVTPANSHIPGTGLGLYLSREIARMHGGDILVESKVQEGSRFTLRLPVNGPKG